MKLGFTYRGIHSSEYGLIIRTNPKMLPVIENRSLVIPGRHGAHHSGTDIGTKEIQVELSFVSKNLIDYSKILRDLASWLDPLEGEDWLTFDIEPDKSYRAILNEADISRVEHVIRLGRGVITFMCNDPYAYSEETAHDVIWYPEVTNEGTAETYPVFAGTLTRQITELSITNRSLPEEQSVVLGRPLDVGSTPFQREELVFHDTMRSTSSWQTGGTIDEGYIVGSITTDKDGFYSEDYGEPVSNTSWQGPSLQKGIGVSGLRDFRAEFGLESKALPNGTGIVEVYLRDANDNVIAKIGLGDNWRDIAQNYFRIQAGSLNTGWRNHVYADKRQWWEHFKGMARVSRIGNVFTFYFAMIDEKGNHHGRKAGIRYVDKNNALTAPIATVQVSFRKYAAYETRIKMRVNEIKIFKINTPPPEQSGAVPAIGNVGDVLEIDNQMSKVLINGEPRLDLVNLDTEFFPLTKGKNRIDVEPIDAINMVARYRKKYL